MHRLHDGSDVKLTILTRICFIATSVWDYSAWGQGTLMQANSNSPSAVYANMQLLVTMSRVCE